MRLRVRSLDRAGIALAERIPDRFVRPFVWIGRFTTPLLWMTAIVAIQALLVTPSFLPGSAIAVILLLPLATVVKLFFRRARPATLYVSNMRIKSYSFPSSHAYSAALAGGYLATLVWPVSVLAGAMMLAIALLIGVSRVRIGAHYPTDVVAGWMLGLTVLLLIVGR